MQTEAYRITGFAAVVSALGFLLRWLQDLRILDPETGLAAKGAPISVLVTLLIVFMAAALGGIAIYLGRCSAPTAPEAALATHSFLHKVVNLAPAFLLAIGGAAQLLQANAANWPESQVVIRRILGLVTLAGAYGDLLIANGVQSKDKALSRRIGAGLMLLFAGLWLIAAYKSAASDPVIWRFAVEMLAICAVLMAIYHLAGYFFEEPTPRRTIFYCYLGAFLCIMAAVDEHPLCESICYAAAALQLLAWGYTLTVNLRRPEDRIVKDTGI